MNGDSKQTILLVDDDSNFREILRAKLEAAGFVVAEASNGEEGLEKVKEIKPDLVLMDVQMPKMNGIEALSRIKADSKTAGTKVSFLTNYGEVDADAGIDDKFAKEAGAVGHMRKTDDLNFILEKVKKELE